VRVRRKRQFATTGKEYVQSSVVIEVADSDPSARRFKDTPLAANVVLALEVDPRLAC
jgi:hypothetical protein